MLGRLGARGETLIVEDLFEDWPENPRDVDRIREIVRATKLHQRTVIGDDERTTAILIELDPWFADVGEADLLEGFDDADANNEVDSTNALVRTDKRTLSGANEATVIAAIQRVLERHPRTDVEIGLSGTPPMNLAVVSSMATNLGRFMALSLAAIAVVLAFLIRRPAGVLLPLVVVSVSLMMLFGWVGIRGEPVNMGVQILPSFLLAVGASAAIHLLVIFFRAYDDGAPQADALRVALGHSGLPITMACVTTAAGMASFLSSDLNIVRDMGILAPVGILITLVNVLTLLPALLCLVPMARREPALSGTHGAIVTGVLKIGDWSVRNPVLVLAIAFVTAIGGLLGVTRVEFDTDPLASVPPADPVHTHFAHADRVMGGSSSLEFVIDSGETNGFHDPSRQRALDDFAAWLGEFDRDEPFIRKTLSLNDVLKEIHQALNENDPDYYVTPTDRALIAQELLLFENSGSDDLEDFVDSEFRRARFSIQTAWRSARFYDERVGGIVEEAQARFPESAVALTGVMAIIISSVIETQEGMARSYLIALITITPLMMILVGTLRGGLSSMVPNLLPIVVITGAFGWIALPIDIFTTMTGSIAIGLAVDDTIHFFHVFYREFSKTRDTRDAVRETLDSTGRALLTTTAVLSIGFGVFMFSPVVPIQIFGAATTLAILLAFLADIMIAPALVTLATRNRQASDAQSAS